MGADKHVTVTGPQLESVGTCLGGVVQYMSPVDPRSLHFQVSSGLTKCVLLCFLLSNVSRILPEPLQR